MIRSDAGVSGSRHGTPNQRGTRLKWDDLDYEGQMIHLRRVWVGNDLLSN